MPRRRLSVIVVVLMVLVAAQASNGAVPELRAAPKGACGASDGSAAFRSEDRLVMTYLYYWYDQLSLDEPSLALHPPAGQPFDWSDPRWHSRQLADMAEADVDVALAVYWGNGPTWSTHGLDALVAARESLLARGARAPAIGLFLDTNLYAAVLADDPTFARLADEVGFELFANQIISFFDRVPECHRATIDGRPLVFLWRPDTEDGGVLDFESGTLEALYARLERRLGARPYIVRERTWDVYAEKKDLGLETDDAFAWGAALNGPLFAGRTVAVGPGYDDRGVPGRLGYVRDRLGGHGYARDLRTAALSGARWLLLETWNELWESTAIAETAEYRREYLDITRTYVEMFRRLGANRARDGWVDLSTWQSNYVTWLADAAEERGVGTIMDGRAGARPLLEADGFGYFHFALQHRLKLDARGRVWVQVEYFDEGDGSFLIEYDSADPTAPNGGTLKPTPSVELQGTGRWRTHTFELPDPRFERWQYGGYGDFRLRDQPAAGQPGHVFSRVVVSTAPSTRPVLLGPENLAVLLSRPGHFFELRWIGVEDAAAYHVQLVPVRAAEAPPHGYGPLDRRRCEGGPAWAEQGPTRAITPEERCLLEHVPAAQGPGLYRWRVSGLDVSGEPVGDWSDWGLLLASDE